MSPASKKPDRARKKRAQQAASKPLNNLVIVVLDSCRHDSFMRAATPIMRKLGEVEQRWSYASWTAPSHYNLLTGLMPHRSPQNVYASEYYKEDFLRYNDRLGTKNLSFVSLVPQLYFPVYLQDLGYRTHARVSLPVLNPRTPINTGFDSFRLMARHNDMNAMIDEMAFDDTPSFHLLNVGETHYPYALPDESPDEWPRISGVHGVFKHLDDHVVGGKLRGPPEKWFDQDKLDRLRQRQVDAVSYLDTVVERLFDTVPKNTWVTITADHGELFGENGFFGHGPIQHDKVYEVPFLEGKDPMIFYIGPGAGFVLTGTLIALIAALFSGFASLLLWPIRLLRRTLRGARAYKDARVRRVVFLGLDGLDPKLVERYMEQGKLPHMQKLARTGSYTRLRTTFPCLSPVAWSCFATGGNPAKHSIFGFLSRNPQTYAPELSSSRVRPPARVLKLGRLRIPLGKPQVELRQKSVPFWKLLGDHEIHSTVLRVPITFPPEEFSGYLLSAMCTPDLRGSQGSFPFYSTAFDSVEETNGLRIPLRADGRRFAGEVYGPESPASESGEAIRLPFTLEPVDGGKAYALRVDGRTHQLVPGEYSDWIPLRFRSGVLGAARGIARVLITSTEPDLEMYMTPINIDPAAPALPISHPAHYAVYLSKLMGSYATLGLAEDTWAMNEGVIDEKAFLDQAYLNHAERETMWFNALEKTPRGVVACVFDASDRIQHMFYRCFEPEHPANRTRDIEPYALVIENLYSRMDDLVGRTLARLGEEDLVFVLSDHGFESFQRGVNLNAWLREEGYLVMKDERAESGEFFENVDWKRTRAYTVGLGGVYLNRVGRESLGIVEPGPEADQIKRELAAKLARLRDAERDVAAITRVDVSSDAYQGPYLDDGPDLLIGYNKGYRAAWSAATGAVTAHVFEDNDKAWGGDHCIDPGLVPGVLFCNREVTIEDPGLEDMAPTAMSLFGIEPPPHMEGRVLV